jgi:hypothetical protein
MLAVCPVSFPRKRESSGVAVRRAAVAMAKVQ